MFQKIQTYENKDTRFLKVKIWLMHLGENLNGSYFDKKTVEDAIPSLSNTPILVYIEENDCEENDFSDHRQILVRDDGKIKIKYLCQSIGVIPESNDAKFEFRLCDDGVEREFLTVQGLVWQKWDDPIDIFNRDAVKSQSMEIHDDFEGQFGDDKLFHFTKFNFFGACGLGKDVQPAMHNATIEMQFSSEDFQSEIQNKMEQFKMFASTQLNDIDVAKELQEGGHKIVPEDILALLEKYNLSEEMLVEKEVVYSDFSLAELEEKILVIFKEETVENVETEVDKDEVEPVTDFSLTSGQLEDELRRELSEIEVLTEVYYDEVYTCPRFYYRDCKPEENLVLAMDEKSWTLVGFSYSINGDLVQVDKNTCKRYRLDYQPMDLGEGENFELVIQGLMTSSKAEFMLQAKEKELNGKFQLEKEQIESTSQSELEKIKSDFAELQQKYSDLEVKAQTFESDLSAKLMQERQDAENEIFESFSTELTEDEMSSVRTKASTLSLEEITEKLFSVAGKKKVSFNLKDNKKLSFQIPNEEKKSTGKAYDELFDKYNKKNEE